MSCGNRSNPPTPPSFVALNADRFGPTREVSTTSLPTETIATSAGKRNSALDFQPEKMFAGKCGTRIEKTQKYNWWSSKV